LTETLGLTPSQTAGPYLSIGLLDGSPVTSLIVSPDDPRAIVVRGRLLDGLADPVLAELDGRERATLVAHQENGGLRFDIRLQGEEQTAFFLV
jgi:protocatechuate 3,4-dioxygenase alpha subunit